MYAPHIFWMNSRIGWNTRIIVAEAEKKGIKERGGEADIYQCVSAARWVLHIF